MACHPAILESFLDHVRGVSIQGCLASACFVQEAIVVRRASGEVLSVSEVESDSKNRYM